MTKRSIWFAIRSSLWFVPGILLLASMVLSLVFVQVDTRLEDWIHTAVPQLLLAEPEAARQIFSVIATSTMTVAGVVFSVTIVTLSLASNQYSPRLLRTFMRDRINQMVLGVFVGLFLYCILVIQAIRVHPEPFVPQVGLWFGLAWVVVAITFLIIFIHHTAASIQAPEIVSRITKETLNALEATQALSKEVGESTDSDVRDITGIKNDSDIGINANRSGYLQDIDIKQLYQIACKTQTLLRITYGVGDFVIDGRPLLFITNKTEFDEDCAEQIRDCFGINTYRTIEQDPAFGMRQIVDIALKALSPGINDTTTAIHCLDYLNAILHTALAIPELPTIYYENSKPRLAVKQHALEHWLNIAFDEIRQHGRGNTAIYLRMVHVLRELLEDFENPAVQHACREHLALVANDGQNSILTTADKQTLLKSVEQAGRVMH